MKAGAAKGRGVAKGSRIKAVWLKFAAVLAKVNGAIVLTLIYFLIIAPINLLSRVMRADLMEKRIGEDPTFWKDPEGASRSLQDSRKQF